MHPISFTVFPCLLGLTLVLPLPAGGQDWTQPWADPLDRPPRVDISVSFGFVTPTDWSDLVLLGTFSSISGVLEQVLVRDLRVEPGTEFGAAVTYWRGRYGFRTQAGLSRSSLLIGDALSGAPAANDASMSVDVDTWSYDVRGAIGLIEYEPRRYVWPYAFFGFGGITYNLARTVEPPVLTFIEHTPSRSIRGDVIVVEEDPREFLLTTGDLRLETVFALNFGVGTDFRLPLGPGGVGLRLELSDQIAPSPVGLRIGQLRRTGPLASDTGVRFGLVHHLRIAAGLVVQVGR